MKLVALFCVILCFSKINSQIPTGPTTKLLEYKNINNGTDGYEFSFKTDDRTEREESGRFINGIWTVVGRMSWVSPEGIITTQHYRADHRGYVILNTTFSFPSGPTGGFPFGVQGPTGGFPFREQGGQRPTGGLPGYPGAPGRPGAPGGYGGGGGSGFKGGASGGIGFMPGKPGSGDTFSSGTLAAFCCG